jgi:hypothetical protein
LNRQRNFPQRSSSSYRHRGEKRLRVIPLAIGAIAITCASMAMASDLLHDATKRPGVEIIKDKIAGLERAAERSAS